MDEQAAIRPMPHPNGAQLQDWSLQKKKQLQEWLW